MAENSKTDMQALWNTAMLDAGSAAWLESLYDVYLHNPNDVESRWREYFETLPRVNGANVAEVAHGEVREHFRQLTRRKGGIQAASGIQPTQVNVEHERKQVRVLQLINAYRFRGHQYARLDPLNRRKRPEIEELDLHYHGLSEADYETVFSTGSLHGPDSATLRDILQILQQTYCGSIGAEYMHITETSEKRWLQHRLETVRGVSDMTDQQKIHVLGRLTAAEGLEKYLHTKYVGQKRFSLEGGETLIPILDEIIHRAGSHGMKEVVIGMAHRGRLNVLVNIMGKTPEELFMEFEGRKSHGDASGDVKYHMGFSSDMQTENGPVHLALAFNPSHLEIVAPVVEGSVRARQERRGDADGTQVLPVQVHGDAAFAGQGVVMETLQMSQSRGYSTKGTLHIIVNNQIGFTTSNIQDSRSAYYCTDVAKMVNAPILHVNGDDPEAVMLGTQIALDYRMTFKKDVVIDMVCYRRHGHNEADEPAATQPMMYHKIRELPTTRKLYADKLVSADIIGSEQVDAMADSFREELDAGHCVVPSVRNAVRVEHQFHIDWRPYQTADHNTPVDTRLSMERIRDLSARLEHMPEVSSCSRGWKKS